MAGSLALVWDLIANDRASGTFNKVGSEAERASLGVGKLLGGFTALAAGGAIAASVKAAADFQASMLLVQTQAGASRAEVEKMSPAILALAGQVAQAPEALATSLYHVESTGLRGAQALEAVKVAAEGAKVGHADLEQTTNALTAAIASGMLPATETYAQAMGQLNTIVGSGDMKMQDLNDALASGLLVVTKQYGVGINDVGAALATFGDNNIRGADAATMLRMAVQSIQNPGKKAAAALGEIGLTVEQLRSDEQTGGLNKALTDLHDHLVNSGIDASQWGQILTDAFTKKAGSGLITLVGQFDRFQQKYQEVSKGADGFGNAWAATTKTANFQFGQLRDAADAVGIKIGTAVLPYVTDLAKHVTDFVQSSGFQNFLTTVGHDAVVLGDDIRGLVGWIVQLPGPVKDFGAALVALRIADHVGLIDKLGSTVGKTTGLFSSMRQEIQLQQALYGMQATGLGDVERAFGGLGTNSEAAGSALGRFGVAAEGVGKTALGGLKSAASDLMGLFGGPWGLAFAGAGVAVAGLVDWLGKDHDIIPKVTVDTQSLTSAIEANNGAIDSNVRRTAAKSLQDSGMFKAAQQWGVSLATLTDAVLGQGDAMTQVQHAAEAYKQKQDAAAASMNNGSQSAGIAADAYEKAGMQSDAWMAALDKLANSTDNSIGKAKQLNDAVNGSTAAQAAATAATNAMAKAAQMMGADVQAAQANNAIVTKNATASQIADLKGLGLVVTTLPNHEIIVSANTQAARDAITSLTSDYHNYSINLGVGGIGARYAAADGGVLPGYTPGKDVHLFTSPTAGQLHLSGGEAVMRPEFTSAVGSGWVSAMNSAARSGGAKAVQSALRNGFAAGGVIPDWSLVAKVGIDPTSLAAAKRAAAAAAPGAPGNVAANAALAKSMGAGLGWGSGAEWNAWYALGMRESGWNNLAANPTSTAYGIPQFLNSTWASVGLQKTSDAATQILGMQRYIQQRYRDPIGAWAHETKFGWYKDGTNYVPSDQLAVLHKGEAVVPASKNQGAPFQGGGDVQVRVYIGDRELTDIVRVEAQTVTAGALNSVYNRLLYNG